MVLMRYYVLRPLVEVNGFELQLNIWQFLALVISTLLIAAAGNIINDYFDQRTDRVNKPNDIIVGVHVKRRVAMFLHQFFNLIGLGIAVYLAYSIGMWKLSIVSFFAAASLWFYSVQFKRDLIIGNVLVAILTGLVPILVGIYEIPLLIEAYGEEVVEFFRIQRPSEDPSIYFKLLFYFIFGYAIFAFALNLIRELQKDMADVKGDARIGAQTIPLVYGIKNAKKIAAVLIVGTIVAMVVLQQKVVDEIYSFIYMIIAVIAPLLAALWINHRAVKRREFVKAGSFLKLAMLGGLFYSIVHYYIYYASELS
jgi:4-hydroxybenzoate polyprenyltransferase